MENNSKIRPLIYSKFYCKRLIAKYLHFHCESLNEPFDLRLQMRIDLSHAHIRAIWADQRQRHPITLFDYLNMYRKDVKLGNLAFLLF